MFGGTSNTMEYLASIKYVLSSIFFSLAVLSGGSYTQPVIINQPIEKVTETVREVPQLGSTISAAADFTTSLAAGITSSATSMQVVSLTSGSETLTSGGLYGFKLAGREYVLGYVSTTTSNTIVYMTRGISRKTGTTTVSAYQSAWGRGTSVEITDAPLLLDLTNKANGAVGYEQPLFYTSAVATTTIDDSPQNLVDYALLTYTAFSAAGAVDATAVQKGLVELATQLETASSTSAGSSGNLAIPATNATSTYNSATAPLRVVVTQNNGKIDPYFIATSSLGISNNQTFTGTTTLAGFTATGFASTTGFSPMTKLAETVLGANATSITLSNIPVTKDLRIVLDSPGFDGDSTDMFFRFNGDTGANYGYQHSLSFSATPVTANTQTAVNFGTDPQTAPRLLIIETDNPFGGPKTGFYRSNITLTTNAPPYISGAMTWNNTASYINSVTIFLTTNQLLAGTRLTAYGTQ